MKLLLLAAATLLATSLAAQRATPCSFTGIRPTCGPVLSGGDRLAQRGRLVIHQLQFQATGAPKLARGFLMFGRKPAKHQIRGTRCFLLVQPMAFVPFTTNRAGQASVKFAAPLRTPLRLFLQSVHKNGRTLVTSNGLSMGCR